MHESPPEKIFRQKNSVSPPPKKKTKLVPYAYALTLPMVKVVSGSCSTVRWKVHESPPPPCAGENIQAKELGGGGGGPPNEVGPVRLYALTVPMVKVVLHALLFNEGLACWLDHVSVAMYLRPRTGTTMNLFWTKGPLSGLLGVAGDPSGNDIAQTAYII